MPASVTDYPINVRPFYVAEARITHALVSGAGRVLDGVTYDQEGSDAPVGEDVLPLVQPLEFTMTEEVFSASDGIPAPSLLNLPQRAILTMEFLVASSKAYGYINRATGSKYDGRGVLEWVARLQDALETKVSDGSVDPYMEQTLSGPLAFSVKQGFMSTVSIGVVLEVRATTVPYIRGARTP